MTWVFRAKSTCSTTKVSAPTWFLARMNAAVVLGVSPDDLEVVSVA